MNYRFFQETGLSVSTIGIGTNRFGHKVDQSEVVNIIDECLNLGINHIDTANVYAKGESEKLIGKAIKKRRHDFVVATKVGWPNDNDKAHGKLSSVNIFKNVEQSLVSLGTDYIDILYLHQWDDNTPIEETLKALKTLENQGKIRFVALSNFNPWQTAMFNTFAEHRYNIRPICIQSEFNLLKHDKYNEICSYLDYEKFDFIPFFPLASGFLTGKYSNNVIPNNSRATWATYMKDLFTEKNFKFLQDLEDFCKKFNISLTQLSLGWLLTHSNIPSVICGVRSVDQLQENVSAIDVQFDLSDLNSILRIHFDDIEMVP